MWLTVLRCVLYSGVLFLMVANFLHISTGKYPNHILALVITICIQSLSFVMAKFGFWERYFALLQRARPAGSREKTRLQPLVDEVSKISGIYPKRLLISPAKDVNASALGVSTLIINKGIMDKMNDDQLKAIIGHEISHLKHGDSERIIIEHAFSAVSDFIVWCVSIIFAFIRGINERISVSFGIVGIIIGFGLILASLFLSGLIFIPVLAKLIDNRILSLFALKQSREAEYRADAFGATVSSPSTMLSALELVENEYGEQALNFFERLMQSHPPIGYRLDRLHDMVESHNETQPLLSSCAG